MLQLIRVRAVLHPPDFNTLRKIFKIHTGKKLMG